MLLSVFGSCPMPHAHGRLKGGSFWVAELDLHLDC